MDFPVFRLEGIVKTKDEMSDFEGPLSLILQLLSKDKIEIRDISISLILEQYLDYLEAMARLDLDIAGEFVAMASHLAYIKTKMLLSGGDEEISELEQLISSLEQLQRGDTYEQIKEAAQSLSGMYSRGGSMMPGPPEYLPEDKHTYIHVAADLIGAMLALIGRENAMIGSLNPRHPSYPKRIVYSISEKISQVLEKLKKLGTVPVSVLFHESASKTELIATLVAVLELCRVGSVMLTGDADDLSITYTGTGRDPIAPDFTQD